MIGKMREKGWLWPVAVLCQFLLLQPALVRQSAAQQGLRIVVVQGSGNTNVTQQIAPKPLIVRVQDASNRPVNGATVVFTAPQSGPSGEFSNDSGTLRVVTGSDGLANAGPFHPNDIAGTYQILVRADFQNQTATATLTQENVTKAKGGHKKWIAIVAIAAGAAGAGVAARKGASSSSSTPTITLGGSAVGSPK